MKAQHMMVLALLVSGSAVAADNYTTAGATASGNPVLSKIWTDKNGDGMIQKEELAGDSQLYKRFETRDTNNDGTLTKDEYFY